MSLYAWSLLAAEALQAAYWLALAIGWRRATRATYPQPRTWPGISVILALRNEAPRLPQNLDTLLAQNYPGPWEIIAVNDRSTDATGDELDRLAERHARLRVCHLAATPSGWSPKKWALRQGIEAAHYPHLAFTDGDCQAPPTWLQQLARPLAAGKAIVLGIGNLRARNGLAGRLAATDTVLTALQYAGAAGLGLPYMGVGRNLAYRRELAGSSPFAAHAQRLSGDDDLFVNAHATAANTAVIRAPGSWTWTEPPPSLRAWLHQKRRHLSAGTAYRPLPKVLLAGFHLSMALSLGLEIGGLLAGWAGQLPLPGPGFLALIALGMLLRVLVCQMAARALQHPQLLFIFPIIRLYWIAFDVAVALPGWLSPPRWNAPRTPPNEPKKTSA